MAKKKETLEEAKERRIAERKKRIADARTQAAIDRKVAKQVEKELKKAAEEAAKTDKEKEFEEQRLSTRVQQKAMLKALEKTLGVVTPALKQVGIARSTYNRWLLKDGWFAEQIKDLENVALDFAESSLHRQISQDIPGSTIFFLKTKGKGRGYVERQEIVNSTPNKYEDMTDEELEELLKKKAKETQVFKIDRNAS